MLPHMIGPFSEFHVSFAAGAVSFAYVFLFAKGSAEPKVRVWMRINSSGNQLAWVGASLYFSSGNLEKSIQSL
jgi:hypothetical protein